MKVCPKCHMTVDAQGECPFCYTTLTYEPTVHSDKERYVLNKYLLLYLLKQSWFSLLCLIVVALKVALTQRAFTTYHLLPLLFLVVSLQFSILGRSIARDIQWKYSESYAVVWTAGVKICTGLLAVLSALIMF